MNRTVKVLPPGCAPLYTKTITSIVTVVRPAAVGFILFLTALILPASAWGGFPDFIRNSAKLAANPWIRPLAPLRWSDSASTQPPRFYYVNPQRPYVKRLRDDNHLMQMTTEAQSDLERVKIICDWVHRQWKHQGNVPAQPNDPIAILDAARKGYKFSCYEYSMVTADCLGSIGIKSRVVVLLPEDVERNYNGNFHVVAEAYLRDRKRWVMVDAQFNSVPTLKDNPLCLAELQHAFAKRLEGIDFGNLRDELKIRYPRDVARYLYYFYTPLDNRMVGAKAPNFIPGGVMLAPLGARAPRSFAQAPVGEFIVTHSLPDFYRKPMQ